MKISKDYFTLIRVFHKKDNSCLIYEYRQGDIVTFFKFFNN